MKNELFNKKVLLVSLFLIVATVILSSFYLNKQNGSVVISSFKDCSELCTDAKCVQFKNNCTYKVKVNYKTKNANNTWTNHELYLTSGEESEESLLCPYIDMKWSYEKAN